jgi:hypothetical protein
MSDRWRCEDTVTSWGGRGMLCGGRGVRRWGDRSRKSERGRGAGPRTGAGWGLGWLTSVGCGVENPRASEVEKRLLRDPRDPRRAGMARVPSVRRSLAPRPSLPSPLVHISSSLASASSAVFFVPPLVFRLDCSPLPVVRVVFASRSVDSNLSRPQPAMSAAQTRPPLLRGQTMPARLPSLDDAVAAYSFTQGSCIPSQPPLGPGVPCRVPLMPKNDRVRANHQPAPHLLH